MPLSTEVLDVIRRIDALSSLHTDEFARWAGSSVTEDNITAGSLTDLIVKTLRAEAGAASPSEQETEAVAAAWVDERNRRHQRRPKYEPKPDQLQEAQEFDPHASGLSAVERSLQTG